MTEWEKKEEQHCQALEEAERIIRRVLEEMGRRGFILPDTLDKADQWLKKWCEEE